MSPLSMIEQSPIAAIVCDAQQPDTPIVACNDPFLALTGYQRSDVMGRNCRFLSGPETEAAARDKLRAAVAAKRPVFTELLNYRKDGSTFWNAVMIVPVFGEDGEVRYFLGSQVEMARGEVMAGISAAKEKVGQLTSRQREILIQMAEGKLNKQIAFDLGLSERTVKMHRAALFRALGVKTSADAIRIAVEAGH